MPSFPIFMRDWGNVLVTSIESRNNKVIITARCLDTTVKGEESQIRQLVDESQSEHDFARIATERGLLAPPSTEEI